MQPLQLKIRSDFPQTDRLVRGKPLVYLDSAATSLKPRIVAERVKNFYELESSNVHRGAHFLGDAVSTAYEDTRSAVAKFINAKSNRQISFNSGTTMGINMLAQSFAQKFISKSETATILVTQLEHHANIVPWQMLQAERNIQVKAIPINLQGELQLDALEKMLQAENVKILSASFVSNALGTINPIKEICKIAHRYGVPVMVDAAQAMLHLTVDVQDVDCDFLVFSGHKMLAPTGVGILYMQEKYLQELPPVIGGGNMIRSVSFAKTTYADAPEKFEAGTPPIASVLGLKTALEYIESLGRKNIQALEAELWPHFYEQLKSLSGLELIGDAKQRAGIFSFKFADIHPHDLSSILDSEGITIRAGHHCCQPLMAFYGVPATARVSLGIYNTKEEASVLVKALNKAREIFR